MHVNGLSDFYTNMFPVSLKILQSIQYKTAFFPCLPWTALSIHQKFSNNELQLTLFPVDVEKQVSIGIVKMLLERGKVVGISAQ